MALVSVEQLHTFHFQERDVFSKLVLKFFRSPAESLLVIATWLWLEDLGFENVFSIILALTDPLIASLANEAVSCFQCLDSDDPPNGFNQIPLTTKYVEESLSLQRIYKQRYSAIIGIKYFLTTICSRIFSDILQQVLPSSSSSSIGARIRHPLIIPGFPHPTFGSINVIPNDVDGDNISNNNLFFSPHGLWGWNANCIATENDRTLFLTFSRGFPVLHTEVIELFTKKYGENCVLGVYMQHDNTNFSKSSSRQQSLFARLVLDSITTVDLVLNGKKLKTFEMHGKHIWARKYEKRDKPNVLIKALKIF